MAEPGDVSTESDTASYIRPLIFFFFSTKNLQNYQHTHILAISKRHNLTKPQPGHPF